MGESVTPSRQAIEATYAAALSRAVHLLGTRRTGSDDLEAALAGYHAAKSALIGYDDGWRQPEAEVTEDRFRYSPKWPSETAKSSPKKETAPEKKAAPKKVDRRFAAPLPDGSIAPCGVCGSEREYRSGHNRCKPCERNRSKLAAAKLRAMKKEMATD